MATSSRTLEPPTTTTSTEQTKADRERRLLLRDLVSGSVGGAVTMVVVHPLDSVRVRLQSTPHATTGSVVRAALQQEGALGLYKGLSGPVAAQGVYKAIIFSVMGRTSRWMRETYPAASPERVSAVSGATAGLVNSFVVCPVEMVRNAQILNIASGRTRVGPLETARRLRAERGNGSWRVLYTGLQYTMLRDGPGLAAWITAFHWGEARLKERGWPEWLAVVGGGCLAGFSFWTVGLPADGLNSHAKRGAPLRDFASPERVRAAGGVLRLFYRGYGVALVRGVPAATITFSVQRAASKHMEAALMIEP